MWFFKCKKKSEDDKKNSIDPVIDCPRCKKPMKKKTKLGITIDKCSRCEGIWLDGGEIENIVKKINENQTVKRTQKKKRQ